jgi:glucosyl-dolichyl phosphate glucuronosyltransferase
MLRTCLASLLASRDQSDDHEIIVVDNASTDDTRDLVAEAAAHHHEGKIRYLYEPVPGAMAARHRGALNARGDVFAFLDDDVSIGLDWITGLHDAFQNPDVVLVGGPSLPQFESPPPAWMGAFYTENESGRSCGSLSLFDGGNRIKEIDPVYIWSLNFAIRRRAFFNMDGFHPDLVPKALQRFQGDGETGLTMKVAKSGLKAMYHPNVLVRHHIPSSRLTAEYFEQRAFFQGVADSYSHIRAAGRPIPCSQSWRDALRHVRWFLDAAQARSVEIYRIKSLTVKAYQAGLQFHLANVQEDPSLLEWVLRKDYWDYALPSTQEAVHPNL